MHLFVKSLATDGRCFACGGEEYDPVHNSNVEAEPHPFVRSVKGIWCASCGEAEHDQVHDIDDSNQPMPPMDGWHETMVTVPAQPPDDGDSKLRRWWTDQAFDEADRTIAKMEKYGSMDLVHIGRAFWEIAGREEPLSDVEAMELGCLFYVYGKVQRAMSAVKSHQSILDDTWFDMHIYPKMAEAARAGVWPL